MKKIYKLTFGLLAKIIFCVTVSSAFAQPANIFNRNHLSVLVGGTTTAPVSVQVATGTPLLTFEKCYGGRAAIRYAINFNRYLSIETGVEGVLQRYAMSFSLDSINYTMTNMKGWTSLDHYGKYRVAHVEVPLVLGLHLPIYKNIWGYAQAGVAIAQHRKPSQRSSIGYSVVDSTTNVGESYAVFEQERTRKSADGLRFPLALGFLIPLPNEAAIRVGYHASYVLENMLTADYYFNTFPSRGNNNAYYPIATGTYRFRGSYQGIELGYVFTGRKTFKRSPKE